MILFEISICVLVFPTYHLYLLVLRLLCQFLPLYSSSSMASAKHFSSKTIRLWWFSSSRAVATLRVCFLRACLCPLYRVWWCSMHFSHLAYVNSNISVIFLQQIFTLIFPSLVIHLYLFVFVKKRSLHMNFMEISNFCHRLTWSKSYIFRFQNRALFFKWVNERKMWDERELNKKKML